MGTLWMGRSRPEFVLRNTERGETYYHPIRTYSIKRDDLLMSLNLNKVPEIMAFLSIGQEEEEPKLESLEFVSGDEVVLTRKAISHRGLREFLG